MQYTIIILVTLAASRTARIEGQPAWALALPAFLIGLPLAVLNDGTGYLISGGGFMLFALIYIVWRIRTSRALGTLEP